MLSSLHEEFNFVCVFHNELGLDLSFSSLVPLYTNTVDNINAPVALASNCSVYVYVYVQYRCTLLFTIL